MRRGEIRGPSLFSSSVDGRDGAGEGILAALAAGPHHRHGPRSSRRYWLLAGVATVLAIAVLAQPARQDVDGGALSRHGLCRPRRERLPAWLPWRRRCRRSRRMRRTPRQRESSILRRRRGRQRSRLGPTGARRRHQPKRRRRRRRALRPRNSMRRCGPGHGPRRCGLPRRPRAGRRRDEIVRPRKWRTGCPCAGGADAGRAILGPCRTARRARAEGMRRTGAVRPGGLRGLAVRPGRAPLASCEGFARGPLRARSTPP